MKLAALVPLIVAMTVHAQVRTPAQKITEAVSAAPKVIADGATVLDWPEKPGAPSKVLRQGTNEWVCYPSMAEGKHDPMCLDRQWQALITALLSKSTPKITGTGIAYMLQGDSGASNTNPYDMSGPTPTNSWVVSPAHVMIVYQDLRLLDAFPTDPHTGGPWVMWKGTPYAHLMVPVSKTVTPQTLPFAPPPSILKPMQGH